MRRFIFILMLLCLLVGSAGAQVTKDWTKRFQLVDSGNNVVVKSLYRASGGFQEPESIYTLSNVTMLDGRAVFTVQRRWRDGSVAWNRVGSISTGNQKVWARDMAIDGNGNVAVIAEIKQRLDFDVMVYRFKADGTPGAKTLIRDKYSDDQFNLVDLDDRPVGIVIDGAGEAYSLSAQSGWPGNIGTTTRVDRIAPDGSTAWFVRYLRASDDKLGGRTRQSAPKKIAFDGSNNISVLAQTVATETAEDMTVMTLNPSGQITGEANFGYTDANKKDYVDSPVDFVWAGAGWDVLGTTTVFIQGVPTKVEDVLQTSGNVFLGGHLEVTQDQFGRPGQYAPTGIRLVNGNVVTFGNTVQFGDNPFGYVRVFGSVFSNPTLKYKTTYGTVNDVAGDSQGYLYATGRQDIYATDGSVRHRVRLNVLTVTGQTIWTSAWALNPNADGNEGKSVLINGSSDFYVSGTEMTKPDVNGDVFAVASFSRFMQDPRIIGISVSPVSVRGGQDFSVTVTLDKKAFTGGYSFTLKSNNQAVIVPTDPLVIPAGKDEGTFTFGSKVVGSNKTVTISAANGVSTTVTILSAWLESLTLSQSQVLGTTQLTGTVTISNKAPTGGIVVSLATTSSNVILPKTPQVTVPAGETTATFNIGTKAVANIDDAFVSATYNATARQPLRIMPPEVTSFTAPASIQGGAFDYATITISGPAPTGGLPVTITSDSDALASMTAVVPEKLTTLTFRLNTMPVTADTLVHLSANSLSAKLNANVTVLAPVLKSIMIDPAEVTAGTSSYAIVELTGITPSGGVNYSIKSDNPAAMVASSATVAAGKSRSKFVIKTGAVSAPTTARITVTYKGVSMSATLKINPSQ